MAKQEINYGITANDGSGDTLREAAIKINENFTELYSGAANTLGYYKIEGEYLGTVNNPDTGGWGGHWMYIDPNGESNSGMNIPSVASQTTGGEFTIYHNNVDSGALRLMVNAGVWYFNQDGTLTMPDGADIFNYNGISVIKAIPQNLQSSLNDYILTLEDGGKHIYRTEGDGYGVIIPTNASVAFPIGTAITVVSGTSECYFYLEDENNTELWGAGFNQISSNWYIPANSMATLLKIGTDKWMLSGAGLATN